MTQITGFLHRNRIQQIMQEIINGRHNPDIDNELRDLIILNAKFANYITYEIAEKVSREIGGLKLFNHRGKKFNIKKIFSDKKKEYLKICPEASPYIENFQKNEHLFYPKKKFNGWVWVGDIKREQARVKSRESLAQKTSAYLIKDLKSRVDYYAKEFAIERAKNKGVSIDQLISSEEEKLNDFKNGENILLKKVMAGKSDLNLSGENIKYIKDVIGLEIVGDIEKWTKYFDKGEFKIENPDPKGHNIGEKKDNPFYHAYNIIVKYPVNFNKVKYYFEQRKFFRLLPYLEDLNPEIYFEAIVRDEINDVYANIGPAQHEDMKVDYEKQNRDLYGGILAKNIERYIKFVFKYAQDKRFKFEVPFNIWDKMDDATFNDIYFLE